MGIEIQFENHIDEVVAKIQGNLKTKMEDATMTVRNKAVEVLSGTRSGRQYYVPYTKTLYTASAPGEAPAVATGRLRQSIATEVSQDGLQGGVGTDLDYGLFLEQGTSKMQPRPWLRPSFEQTQEEVKKIFTEGYNG